jgi:hypothetical protein
MNVDTNLHQSDSKGTSSLPIVDSVAIANINSFISAKNELDVNKKSLRKLYYTTNIKTYKNSNMLNINAKFEGLFNNPKVLINYPSLSHLVLNNRYSISLRDPEGDILFDIGSDSLYGYYIIYSPKSDFTNLIGANPIIKQIDVVKNWQYIIIKLLPPENTGNSNFY